MKQFLLLALLFFGTLVSAQKFSINGSVEGGGEMLASATVVVLNEKDSTIVSFGLTSKEGKFRIDNLKPLSYLIQITYLGFEQYSQPLVIEDSDIDLKTVTLKVNSALIEQVEIKGEHVPLLVKKDTLEFNAAAFQTQPNEVVEDLLKKLPGVEVESDGSIKAQGEDVEQVLVDGKKFFGDDPTIATRNLPADAVDKVQIFDQKSDMAEFSGVDDGERQKTINLELKEDRKNGYFGNLSAGYGSDDRYNGKISLNRFNPTTQMSIIGNFNNVNEQGFSVSDYASFMGGFGGFRRGGNAPIFNGLSNGFVVTNAGGLNINHDFSDKTELSINYFINSIENEIESESIKENFVSESESFFENENSDQINKSDNHRVNLEFEHEIDSTQDLRIRGGLTYNNGNLISDNYTEIVSDNFVANLTDSDYQTNGKNLNLSSNLTYRKKFGSVKKRIFTFNGSLNDATNDLLADLNSQNIIFSDNNTLETILVQDVIQSDQDNQYRLEFSFVEPLSYGKYLEFKYRRQNFNNDVLTEYFDIEADMQTLNQDLSNAYVRDYYYDRYSTAFHFNSDVSQLTLEAAVQNSHLQGDLLFEEISIKKDVLRFLPRINWRYEIGQAHNIRLSYSTNVNMPSLEQLQPIPDNSNPLNIYIGNPDLIPEYSHRLRLNYFKYDQFNFRSFYAFFNFNYTKNQIINESFIDENFVQMQSPTNVDYNFNSTGSAEYSTPLRFINITMSLRNRIGYSKGFTFINNRENKTDRINGNVRLRFENRNKEKLDWRLGGSYSYNINKYSESERNNLNYSSQNVFAEITYNHKNSLAFSTEIDVNFYSEEDFSEATTIPIWKASISKYFLKDQRGELKFSVFDILNKNQGISRTQNLNFIQNSVINSLGQYYMLSFTYAIKGQSSGGSGGGRRGGFRR